MHRSLPLRRTELHRHACNSFSACNQKKTERRDNLQILPLTGGKEPKKKKKKGKAQSFKIVTKLLFFHKYLKLENYKYIEKAVLVNVRGSMD